MGLSMSVSGPKYRESYGIRWDFDSPRPIIDEETSTETVDEFTELLLGGLQDRWLNSLVATKETMVEDTEQLVAISYKQ